jgi:transcription elongation factor GreB
MWLMLITPPPSIRILRKPAHPFLELIRIGFHKLTSTKINMGRYRPPTKPGSQYITAEGNKALEDELDYLWKKLRPEVTRAVTAAAAEGDRSENAEYIYRKKQLREIDSRVRFLRKRLEGMIVVSQTPDDHDFVYFGAWVELEDADGNELSIRIVGPDEIDPKQSYISMDSPMGQVLLGKKLDDEFLLKLPDGEINYCIVNIHY